MDFEKPGTMNILIVKLSAVGDVVHTLPSLAVLRRLYPEAHITWVIEEAAADLIIDHPYLNHVIVSRRKNWIKNIKKGRIVSTICEAVAFLRELRNQRYDLVIDFHGLFKSAILVFLSRGKRKLGYDSLQELSGLFYTEKIREDMAKHAVDRYLDFIAYLAGNVRNPRSDEKDSDCLPLKEEKDFLIPINEDNRSHINQLFHMSGIGSSGHFIAVNPIALWRTKLWDEGKFAFLCDRIVQELKYQVILTGKDPAEVENIRSMMKSPSINLAGQTTLRDLAYLYRLATLVVTTDSGPMHIAAAMGTPVVALFGPTDPQRTGPCGEGHAIISNVLTCSPCFSKNCDTIKCMGGITVEEVFGIVKEKLGINEGREK